ncbi:hypothetical protein HZZ13_22440 [Bradyrhizobium sp. CNPSo 4010]|uniref:Uncharacterized protein n=1 Tax=Bradyrhizobium agreste TaxID=2751811 RepID=A0ABS0PTJ5_9BRAD|nr:hypothetical protein [Bradyrhizobium agreste]MBH5400530.1 hypothetical protein [Bradyrhizobium agreste]
MASEEEALELFKDAAEIIPVMGDIVGFGVKLNEFVNRPGGDPMLRALGKVHGQLAALNDAVLASWVTAREDNLAFLTAHSSASLITANNYLQSGSPDGDVEWEAKKALADRDSLIAVQALIGDMNGGYWLRPQSNRAISQMGDPSRWMECMPDRAEVDSFNRVWDHRWALPATIYAITTRVAVLTAFSAADAILKSELERYLDFLGPVFRKMESGVRFKQNLSDYEINYLVIPQGRAPVAAADIYGGYSIYNIFSYQFHPYEFDGYPSYPGIAPPLLTPDPDKMLKNIKSIGQHWRDIICQQIGVADLLLIWGQLENLRVGYVP